MPNADVQFFNFVLIGVLVAVLWDMTNTTCVCICLVTRNGFIPVAVRYMTNKSCVCTCRITTNDFIPVAVRQHSAMTMFTEDTLQYESMRRTKIPRAQHKLKGSWTPFVLQHPSTVHTSWCLR